jgi:DNA-binding transcriptional MerR regulator
MRLAELASTSGCPIATIKYYVREGLLPAGDLVHAKEAEYGDRHVARLRMIRVLRDLGELSIAEIRRVVLAIDDHTMPLPQQLGAAYYALPPHPIDAETIDDAARDEVLAFAAAQGWTVTPHAPSVALFADVLAAARAFWGPVGPENFDRYAKAFDELARGDVEMLDDMTDHADAVRQVVVGTVVWDRAIIALRRMAADHYSSQRFGNTPM